jgi:hypothetical protein
MISSSSTICLIVFLLYGTLATTATTSSINDNEIIKKESLLQLRRGTTDDGNTLQRSLQGGSVGQVTQLRLVNAIAGSQNGQSLINPLTNGRIINLSNYASRTFNIEAIVATSNGPIGSVRFTFGANNNFRTESNAPYSFCGDTNSVYRSCSQLATVGSYTVTATPFSLTNGLGIVGQTYTLSFTVIDQPSPPIPIPVKAPTKAPPVNLPVKPPTKAPVKPPTKAPVKPPTKAPVKPPTKAPVKPPTKAPVKIPSPVSPALPAWIEVNPDDIGVTARHEACFVMVGRKAYLLAGRGIKPVNIYNPITRTWVNGTAPPKEIHHTQCVAVDDSIWIVSSWTGGFPKEKNNDLIYVR